MNNEFKIMLAQCEKYAQKLAEDPISDDFFVDLDIFDNFFQQLQQIVENNNISPSKNDMALLQQYIDTFTAKLTDYKDEILIKAKNAGKTETIRNYGSSSAHDGALKFDKRS